MDASEVGQALNEMPHTMKLIRWVLPCLPLAFVLSACGGQLLDVGSNSDDAGGSGGSTQASAGAGTTSNDPSPGDGGMSPAPTNGESGAGAATRLPHDEPEPPLAWPDAASCGVGSSALEGSWSGYVQGQGDAYNFTLQLAGSDEAPCGTITFGEPQEYPAATDPEAGYLDGDESFKMLQMAPGFSYTLLAIQVDASRLRFRVSFAEPYASWCALQTAYYSDQNGDYACVQTYGSGAVHRGGSCNQTDSDGNEHSVSCTQFGMCESIDPPCACQAGGCQANADGSGPYFDVHVTGMSASGVMDNQNVFLEKE
jgi:hypothetical protein